MKCRKQLILIHFNQGLITSIKTYKLISFKLINIKKVKLWYQGIQPLKQLMHYHWSMKLLLSSKWKRNAAHQYSNHHWETITFSRKWQWWWFLCCWNICLKLLTHCIYMRPITFSPVMSSEYRNNRKMLITISSGSLFRLLFLLLAVLMINEREDGQWC